MFNRIKTSISTTTAKIYRGFDFDIADRHYNVGIKNIGINFKSQFNALFAIMLIPWMPKSFAAPDVDFIDEQNHSFFFSSGGSHWLQLSESFIKSHIKCPGITHINKGIQRAASYWVESVCTWGAWNVDFHSEIFPPFPENVNCLLRAQEEACEQGKNSHDLTAIICTGIGVFTIGLVGFAKYRAYREDIRVAEAKRNARAQRNIQIMAPPNIQIVVSDHSLFTPQPPPAIHNKESFATLLTHLEIENEDIPEHFICSITKAIMDDPVVARDGHTYERSAIEAWLADHLTSPMTGKTLDTKELLPNHSIKSAINSFVDKIKAQKKASSDEEKEAKVLQV